MMPLNEPANSVDPLPDPAPPPSVLLRYASLLVVVVMALTAVIAWESWACYQAAAAGSFAALQQRALALLGIAAGALPLALAAWLAVLAWIRCELHQHGHPARAA